MAPPTTYRDYYQYAVSHVHSDGETVGYFNLVSECSHDNAWDNYQLDAEEKLAERERSDFEMIKSVG
eukprot:8646014-Pyramimonas_sp.AAC.1